MPVSTEIELRALDLFGRLSQYPNNARLRARLLKRESADVLARLARFEAGHAARAAMPTILPGTHVAPALKPPERIGPFRLTTQIGTGGMGEVWRGERDDGLFEQSVAIKLLHDQLGPAAAIAFEAERRILAKLDHPDIVRLTDGGVTQAGRPYLIMDYVEGAPLDDAVRDLPLFQRVDVFRRVASVVQYAHGRLVAHADLKPSNIVLDTQGRVRLLDFGIAGLLTDEGGAQSETGAMTRDFASPQRRDGAPPSIADDVYALGRILALICGDAHDDDLNAIIAKAVAPDEAARYATVAALSLDLERRQSGLPVSARADSPGYRAAKFVARHRVGVAASVLAVLALLGTTIFATFSSVRAEKARIEAAARFDDARGASRYLLFTLMDRLEAHPNTLALRSEVADVAQHYLDRLSHGAGTTPAVRIETARGLIRLAEAQGVPGFPNLADPASARKNLDRALAVIGGDQTGDAPTLAVTALIEQARLSSYVDNRADVSLALLRRAQSIAANHPGVPAIVRGRLYSERSSSLGWKSAYRPAIAAAKTALTILPVSDAFDSLVERAKADDVLGDSTYFAGDEAGAVTLYRDAAALLERAHARYPSSRTVMQRLARERWSFASTLRAMNRNAEALALLNAVEADLRSMVAFDQDDQEDARLLMLVALARGGALADTGHVEDGLAAIKANIAERRALWLRHPGEVRRLRDVTVAVKELGDVQIRRGRLAEGCRTYGEFRILVGEMARRGKLADMDMVYSIDDLHKQEQKFCGMTGREPIP